MNVYYLPPVNAKSLNSMFPLALNRCVNKPLRLELELDNTAPLLVVLELVGGGVSKGSPLFCLTKSSDSLICLWYSSHWSKWSIVTMTCESPVNMDTTWNIVGRCSTFCWTHMMAISRTRRTSPSSCLCTWSLRSRRPKRLSSRYSFQACKMIFQNGVRWTRLEWDLFSIVKMDKLLKCRAHRCS